MAFNLGNFAVKEVIYGVAQNFDDELLYTLDQLSSAEIAVEADSNDIVDKNGAVIRTVYNAKTATITATSALLSPAILNASSGSEATVASTLAPIEMPKIVTVAAAGTVDVKDAIDGATFQIIGIYANGANGAVLTQSTTASLEDKTFKYDSEAKTITVPAATEGDLTGAPEYLVKYQRNVESGIAMVNKADEFPDTIRLTLYVAIMDPCDDKYKAAYVYIPSFTPDPSVTISLDSESTEIDYSGNVNVDYCSTSGKVLYYIYFPDEEAVTSGVIA